MLTRSGTISLVRRSTLLALVLAVATGGPTHGGVRASNAVVDCNADSAALASAIADAAPGETLNVSGACVGSFQISTDLTLVGRPSATLDGNDATRVLTVGSGAAVTLTNVVVTRGRNVIGGGLLIDGGDVTLNGNSAVAMNVSTWFGGGVVVISGSLTLDGNATVSGNSGDWGGGIFNSGTVTLNGDSTVTANSAVGPLVRAGGGIVNATQGTVRMNGNSTVAGNFARSGAGISSFGLSLTLSGNARVTGNTATGDGGGIYSSGAVSLDGNANVSGNSASRGGGVYNYHTTVALSGHSAVWGNVATDVGGGIFNESGTVVGSSRVYANTPDDIAP